MICESFHAAELSTVQTLLANRKLSISILSWHTAQAAMVFRDMQYWVKIPAYIISNVGVQFSTGQCRDAIGYHADNRQIFNVFEFQKTKWNKQIAGS